MSQVNVTDQHHRSTSQGHKVGARRLCPSLQKLFTHPRAAVYHDGDLMFVCCEQDTTHMQTVSQHSAGLDFPSLCCTASEISAHNHQLLELLHKCKNNHNCIIYYIPMPAFQQQKFKNWFSSKMFAQCFIQNIILQHFNVQTNACVCVTISSKIHVCWYLLQKNKTKN